MQLPQLAPARQSDDQASSPESDAVSTRPLTELSTEEAVNTVMDTVSGIVQSVLAHVPMLVAGALILAVTFFIVLIAKAVVRRLLRNSGLRGSLRELAARFTSIIVWGVGLLVAALVVFPGLTPSKALAGLGVGSIAIGLAFKDIFENFFAGVLILWKFPFENGDFISCDGILGKVEHVSVRNTLVRTVEGDLVIIPNATLYKNAVDVLTDHDVRRISIIVGVAYGEDIDKSRNVIADAVRSCDSVRNGPAPQIFANEFASSSVNFEVAWWTGSTPLARRESRDEVVAAIKRALDDAGIEIPFPYRTLTFAEPLAMRNESATEQAPARADAE